MLTRSLLFPSGWTSSISTWGYCDNLVFYVDLGPGLTVLSFTVAKERLLKKCGRKCADYIQSPFRVAKVLITTVLPLQYSQIGVINQYFYLLP